LPDFAGDAAWLGAAGFGAGFGPGLRAGLDEALGAGFGAAALLDPVPVSAVIRPPMPLRWRPSGVVLMSAMIPAAKATHGIGSGAA
jgi:hypothetical protein